MPESAVGRMMIRQQMGAGSKYNSFRLHQGLSNQQVRRRIGFPWRSKMLSDPGLIVSETVSDPEHLEVPFLAGLEITLRRMRRH